MDQNNQTLPEQPVASEKKPFYYTWHILLGVLCLLLVAGSVWALLRLVNPDLFVKQREGSSSSSFYDFEATDPKDFVNGFDIEQFKNNVIPGKGSETKVVDDAYVNEYFSSVLLNSRKPENDGAINRTGAVDYADVVYMYLLDMRDQNGDRLADQYVGANYTLSEISVGGRYFGVDFDRALTGLVPNDYAITLRRSGSFSASDILKVSYTAKTKKDGEDVSATVSSARLVLSEKDAAFRDALLAACTEVGKQFEFKVTEDYDRDGDTEEVTYTMTVNAVVTEQAASLTFTIPDDFFTASSAEELRELNGKTVTLRVIPSYSIAYKAFTPDTILTEQVADKYTSEDTRVKEEKEAAAKLLYVYTESGSTVLYSTIIKLDDVADKQTLIKNYLDYQKTVFESAAKSAKESTELNLIADALLKKLDFNNFTDSEVAKFYTTFTLGQYLEAYINSGTGLGFEDYLTAIGVISSSTDSMDDLREDIEFTAKQQFFIAWLYQKAVKTDKTEDEVRKSYYEEYLPEVLVYYGYVTEDQVKEWTEKGVLEKKLTPYEKQFEQDQDVGTGTAFKDYHLKQVADYVYDWLIANNTVNYTVEPEKAE